MLNYVYVLLYDVTKNNDTVKKGISVRKNGEKIGRIYYWNGEALDAFLGDVESSPLPDIDFEMSLKKQKDNIVAILINAEANKERLKEMPHRKVEDLDLAIVYKIIFKKDSEGITSSDINNGMMAMLRVTELHGLSTIRHYQLIEVIEKIDELYQQSLQGGGEKNGFYKKRNAMLLDAENFSYIFGTPVSDEDNNVNKVKTALLLIQKDFKSKVGFSPIQVRPIPMFSIGFCNSISNEFGSLCWYYI